MFGIQDFLLGGAVPMLAAAAAFAIVWRLARRESAAWPAGVVVGYAAGFVALVAHQDGLSAGFSRLVKPTDAAAWIPLMALAAAVLALFPAGKGWRQVAAGAIFGAMAVLAPLRLLWGGRYLPTAQVRALGFATDAWSLTHASLVFGLIALAATIAWLSWAESKGEWSRTRGALLVGAVTAAALTAALTGSFTFAQYFGVLAASIGGCVVAAWALKVSAGPEAAACPILLVLACLLVLAVCNSETKLWQAILLAVSATLAVASWPLKLGAVARTIAVLVAAAIPVAAAVIDFAATQSRESSEESYYGASAPPHSIHPPPSTRSPA